MFLNGGYAALYKVHSEPSLLRLLEKGKIWIAQYGHFS